MAGSGFKAFEQTQAVDHAEGLQDYRRREEGHLIMADNRPLLVMSFGTKYTGGNATKWKVEGNFDIPKGYKVIIKWFEDEIVFMTREGNFGPEFQIVYLPKSASQSDFTMFDWSSNIAEIWSQFLNTVEAGERDDRDLSLFTQGPWRTFGVTRDEVQIALRQGVDEKTTVKGILYCRDGNEPTVEEYAEYLGFDEKDVDYEWIARVMKDEELPAAVVQVVREQMVYWVDGTDPTDLKSDWQHPYYDKYRRMLQTARKQKPADHWKAITPFRIEFLLTSLYTPEHEESGQFPMVETIENVLEMASIFGINIKEEPYLVHVIRRALRHYGNIVREKRRVEDIDDVRNMMIRYRGLVQQFELAAKEEAAKIKEMKMCVQCDTKAAVIFCDACRDFFCQGCFDRLHSKGRRKQHPHSWVEMGLCAECKESTALFHCVQCADLYCRDCFKEWHIRGGRRNHVPIVLRSFNSQSHVLPDAKMAMGTGARRIVEQAHSKWFCFTDENNIKLYWNLEDNSRRRDVPLATINAQIEAKTAVDEGMVAVLNEPIADNLGGGLAVLAAGPEATPATCSKIPSKAPAQTAAHRGVQPLMRDHAAVIMVAGAELGARARRTSLPP
eukprot:CAMPEP_0117464950 /NCGR_PEP_ID=MMETSP0784-20121206/4374_1 /TAXON_ID=39447 /ORGANISM="" /LENGTH=611 /DNA_ID=CAMNT_0005258843 /DNA_START=40 /DNA_END=1872 /DNA_ORIENTATION=-